MVPDRSNCQLRNYASTEEILGIVTQYIDVTDESQVLTHHGLDSITAVRLQTAIAAALGVRLPLVDFLGEATVQSLVDSLNASEIPVAPEPARPEESDISVAEEVLSGPLTPTQAMYWVGRQSDYPPRRIHSASRRLSPPNGTAIGQRANAPSRGWPAKSRQLGSWNGRRRCG